MQRRRGCPDDVRAVARLRMSCMPAAVFASSIALVPNLLVAEWVFDGAANRSFTTTPVRESTSIRPM